MNKLSKIIKIKVYSCTLTIRYTNNIRKEVYNILKKNNVVERFTEEDPGKDIAGASFDLDMDNYWLFYSNEYPLNINTISHEIWHLVNTMIKQRGIQSKDDEAGAWLTGYITEEVMNFFKNKHIDII